MQDTSNKKATQFRITAIGLLTFVVISMFLVFDYSDNNDTETAQFISGVLLVLLSIPLVASIILLFIAARLRKNNETEEMKQKSYSKRIAAYNLTYAVTSIMYSLSLYYLELYPAAALAIVFFLFPVNWMLIASSVPLVILNIFSFGKVGAKDKKALIIGSVSAILFGCYTILMIINR